jgi:hypothetical protein
MTLSNAAAASLTAFFYSANNCNSETFENNTFASTGTLPNSTLYFIYLPNNTPNKLISGNRTVGAFNAAGGTTYCYYNSGSPMSGIETITNNNFSNINILSGTSAFYGIYSSTSSSQNRVMSNNTISNVSSATTSTMYCIAGLSANNSQVYDNFVNDITSGGSIYGIYISGTNSLVYKNRVNGLTSTTTGNKVVFGGYSDFGNNTWYNNFFSDLKAPDGNGGTASTYGLFIYNGTNVNLYYNTIYLDFTSNNFNNGSAAVYISSNPTNVDMRNNIFK